MSYKTTKKDFESFRSECEAWVEYFGLKDWEITYSQEDSNDSRASCGANYTGKIATIALTNEWDYKPEILEIRRVAFHEVGELLTAPLCIIAESRYVTQDQVAIANHYIIRVLENTLFNDVNPSKRKKGK